MSVDEMLRFVIQVQGETHADSNYVKDIFNMLKHHGVFHPRGLHLEEFYRYLLSDFNSPLPLSGEVWQDMTQPLSHYFLYTGHNSYLTGNQLNSRSSTEPIVKALRRGVRVIELDLWPNSSGTEAEVRHGGTLTSTEDLQKCLNEVKENAFEVSDYPVVLTLEDHLSPDLQKKVAKMVRKTFGGTLFQCRDEYKKCFPSPQALKNKILISTKPPKEYLQTQISQGASAAEPVNAEELIQDEDEKTVAVEYRDLISIHAGNRRGGLKNCLNGDPNRVIRLSMSEQWLETLAKSRGPDIVKFTQRNILRIFPKTTRFDSSNYDPLVGWIHGAQMVAFNMQSHGKFLWMMQGMFKANGGCGYIKTILKVKIYNGEGWNMDFSQDHFDRYSPPDFYAKASVGIAGIPSDTISYRTETDTDEWFPVWDEEFEFPLRVPELALLCITVKDHDKNTPNDFAGQTCLPLSEIRPGIRAVRLHDRVGDVFQHARLLVRFVLEPPLTSSSPGSVSVSGIGKIGIERRSLMVSVNDYDGPSANPKHNPGTPPVTTGQRSPGVGQTERKFWFLTPPKPGPDVPYTEKPNHLSHSSKDTVLLTDHQAAQNHSGKYTPQYMWLEQEFPKVNRTETPWLIVLMHSPWYNSYDYHYMEGETMRVMYEPWFVKNKVDVVFAGHVHGYERSERISNIAYNVVNGICRPVKDLAPVYITIGDGGNLEGLSTIMTEPQPEYSAFREASFGHAIFSIKNRTHAYYGWHRNQDGYAVDGDTMWLFNRIWNPIDDSSDDDS
ncbi:hypothetical protein Bca101_016847 [Brassica carinata]